MARSRANRLLVNAMAWVEQHAAERSGLFPDAYAGHSLRAGLATQAAINQVSERAIMKQTRHRSRAMLDRYVRDASLFRENSSASVGL